MKNCPKCGRRQKARVWKRAASWPLITTGLVFAIPTIGVSLVATLYGVFLRVPDDCACDSERKGEQQHALPTPAESL